MIALDTNEFSNRLVVLNPEKDIERMSRERNRLKISNFFNAVSYKQFVRYSQAFQKAALRSFGTDITMEITAYKEPKATNTSSFMIPDYDEECALQAKYDGINDANTLIKTDTIGNVTEDIFNQAACIEINIHPVKEIQHRPSAWAQATFGAVGVGTAGMIASVPSLSRTAGDLTLGLSALHGIRRKKDISFYIQ